MGRVGISQKVNEDYNTDFIKEVLKEMREDMRADTCDLLPVIPLETFHL